MSDRKDPKDHTAYCQASMCVCIACCCTVALVPMLLAAGMQPAPAFGLAVLGGGACGFAATAVLLAALMKDRKSTRLNSSHVSESRMPSSA